MENQNEGMKKSKIIGGAANDDASGIASTDQDNIAIEEPNHETTENYEADRPFFFSYIPKFFRFDNAPIEATGCSINMWGRATLIIASIFIGPALLELASVQAQSQSSCELDDDDCLNNTKVYGFKPSSLLANMAIMSGVVSTVFLPIIGAVIDHTPHRRGVGAVTAASLTLIKIIEIGILSPFW
eukprot:CAMPEP_0178907188 /NCGR_PEP_ID=MMETSP0786-20121207/7233_1 /TAXON_ID=186022 /ORGANISM="Thalassionema frauenfeldii, Strain CCMP 1798" /LENGTH=184 /DNA_ID=CAMNT_0020578961 /DNA_START=86 /DNA_END=637 /DNA_ORIENTATION=-